jgi:polar amino acid transport system substrate-binding protein
VVLIAGRRRPSSAKSSVRLGAAVATVLALGAAGCGSDGETATIKPDPSLVQEGALTVCTSSPYEPFEFEENHEFVGFDIDLANEVAKRLGVKTVIRNMDFDAISSGEVLNDGKCDVAAAALTITGERARVLDFSSPYFNASQAMVVREGSGISSLDDLGGLKVGVQKGTTGELYVTDNAPVGTKIVPFKVASDVDAALDSGEVDAAVYDVTVVDDVLSRYPDFEKADRFDTGEQYGMAVKKNSNVDLLRVINDVLANLQAGEGYHAIYARWISGSSDNQ